MLAGSAKALFARLIDYAGLFPPAALSMEEAVANYARYRGGEDAWMLGRFVVPAARAHEVPPDFPLSVLGVDEVKAVSAEDIRVILSREDGEGSPSGGATYDDRQGIPRSARDDTRPVYVEITDSALIPAIAQAGLRAKIRCGGEITPSTADVARFLRACAENGVAFKATAGLHHPIRRGTMHGFVNVFLAAALIHRAEEILDETEPGAFTFDDDAASWRGHAVSAGDLARIRSEFAISFGSCSFEEPVQDLKGLGWL